MDEFIGSQSYADAMMDSRSSSEPERGVESSRRTIGWKTPIHISAEKGHYRSVRALLDYKADANTVDGTRCTALHLAAKNGHVDVVEVLLAGDTKFDATDEMGWTALHYVVDNDCEAVVRLLIKRGADLGAKARDKDPLHQQRYRCSSEALLRFPVVCIIRWSDRVRHKNRFCHVLSRICQERGSRAPFRTTKPYRSSLLQVVHLSIVLSLTRMTSSSSSSSSAAATTTAATAAIGCT